MPYINFFSEMTDYKEANQAPADSQVFLGHLYSLSTIREDVFKNGENSKYFGQILLPEARVGSRMDLREPSPGKWTYEKNAAFMAGAIEKKRSFLLVSSINHYLPGERKRLNQLKNNQSIERAGPVTIDEIFWLLDNGYEAKQINEEGHILFTAPKEFNAEPQIRNYPDWFEMNVTSAEDRVHRLEQFSQNIDLNYNYEKKILLSIEEISSRLILLKNGLSNDFYNSTMEKIRNLYRQIKNANPSEYGTIEHETNQLINKIKENEQEAKNSILEEQSKKAFERNGGSSFEFGGYKKSFYNKYKGEYKNRPWQSSRTQGSSMAPQWVRKSKP